ncbi:nicotinate-nucleotide--dimethylbenzimidazole phosphoribosyltransferase [Actinacidiphila acididurans]|uniref:Nicotinate-nucleotide--dimethylbenzimidazole phosphoribosyltransferase n=1 Tax=Actinacidiphila acididurans TaxID=2784346 RepID=A0ABS2TTZ6_9ACTN|nr:nicotinate-nucleotide--dimethylbenzimidazole phosphoribosyltransferase [Actinacidiphila acididurans]MBM9505418.1 nicotinate-nucleotide--dimethylbenzimidazole phosphoribosyltransferase [Actinacidiphila acididurans]
MSGIDVDEFGSLVERPEAGVRRDSQERWARLVAPAGALGRPAELADWLAAVQGVVPVRPITRPRVLVFAGDHGVAALDVSVRPAGSAVELARAVLDGTAPVAVLARQYGATVRLVDLALDCDEAELPADVTAHRVRRGSGRLDIEDALSAEEAEQAFRTGMALADEEADSGTDLVLLGDLSVGGTTVAGVLIAALCGTDASVVTGRGSGIDDLTWMRKCAAIRDGLRRARPVLGDQLALLAAVGGADFAAITGFLLQAAVRKLPVVLDGVVSAACGLVAQRIAFRAPDWWLAGHVSGEPGQAKALDRISLEPLLDFSLHTGSAVGALMALPLLQAAAALSAELPDPKAAAEADAGPGSEPDPAPAV